MNAMSIIVLLGFVLIVLVSLLTVKVGRKAFRREKGRVTQPIGIVSPTGYEVSLRQLRRQRDRALRVLEERSERPAVATDHTDSPVEEAGDSDDEAEQPFAVPVLVAA